jgi:hypothetical protein
MEATPRGNIVRVAVFMLKGPWAALILTGVDSETGLVVIGKTADVAPGAIVTC